MANRLMSVVNSVDSRVVIDKKTWNDLKSYGSDIEEIS